MRSHRIARSFALSALLASAVSGRASAGPKDPAPAAPAPDGAASAPVPPVPVDAADQAAAWLRAGNKAFKEGNFVAAERAYREAFAVKRGYDIAGNLGAAELAQGKLREAAQHLAFTLRMFPITGEPQLREQMARAYDQCRQGVGAVRVRVDLKGATILVDGAVSGEAPLADEVFVEPGEHVIEARLDGYTSEPQRVSVPKGGTVEVTPALTPRPRPVETVVVPARRRSLVPGLGLAAGAAVGLIGGVTLLSLSASKRSSANGLDAQILDHQGSCVGGAANYDAGHCPALQSTLRSDDALHDAAVGAFVVGGAAAVGAATYLLWPQRAPWSDRGVRVTPVLGAGSSGVIVSRSF